jgi:hypothetical protein
VEPILIIRFYLRLILLNTNEISGEANIIIKMVILLNKFERWGSTLDY